MTRFSLVRFSARGVARRRVRTLLIVFGIAVLIFTYVAVQSLVSTIEVNSAGSLSPFGGEVDVWSKGASYPLISRIPESYVGVVRNVTGVAVAAPLALALLTVDSAEAVVAGAIPGEIPLLLNYSMVKGTMIASNQSGILALGSSLAGLLGKSAGDTVQLNGAPFLVSGVYQTNTWMDNSAIIPHAVAQEIIGMEGGTSMIVVITKSTGNVDSVIGAIKSLLPGVDAFKSGEAPSRISPIFASVETVAAAITVILTVVAVLGITNSNLNSLRERMRVFAVFKATGASYGQIIRLVLYESLLLGVLGTLLGLGVSYLALRPVFLPVVESISVPINLVPSTFLYAGVLGVAVSFLAGVYPAVRIARVRPQEVFRFG